MKTGSGDGLQIRAPQIIETMKLITLQNITSIDQREENINKINRELTLKCLQHI